MCIVICFTVSDVMNFEINIKISNLNIFLNDQKSWDKNFNILEMKNALNMK